MAANPPNPDRFIENSPRYRVMMLVAARYDEMFTPEAEWAQAEILRRMQRDGLSLRSAVEAFEGRPMHERLIGPRPRYPVTYDYEER
jgi:hypothetical protein